MAVPVESLRAAVSLHGTPCYVYDIGRLRAQFLNLSKALPEGVDLLYSLKANPSLGLCEALAELGIGADVASIGEVLTALAAGFPPQRIQLGGPFKTDSCLDRAAALRDPIVSVDSISDFQRLVQRRQPNPALLRLRPDFPSQACMPAGPTSRFGIDLTELTAHRDSLLDECIRVIGFHVHAGSQVVDGQLLVKQLTSSAELCLRAADLLRIDPVLLNLGGGFGVAYKRGQASLDLAVVGEAIDEVLRRVRPARVALELGRYLVAEAGWYVTTIVGQQCWNGRHAVVVDGGTHQRGDFCGLRLRSEGDSPVLVGRRTGNEQRIAVLGCLCSPDDILAEAALLPSDLAVGDVLAFPNAGAYGLSASPNSFLAHPLPAEIAFDGERMVVLRQGNGPDEVLRGQASWRCVEVSCRDN